MMDAFKAAWLGDLRCAIPWETNSDETETGYGAPIDSETDSDAAMGMISLEQDCEVCKRYGVVCGLTSATVNCDVPGSQAQIANYGVTNG
jgi:hypothetical protein